ncbi:hypothetical protein BDY21DRAFT_343439 [Lineolata rhizophorae]|uniref:protein-tyrosine-phosphatase n=1 Tax=Lineolata rhizophorae TaxID=578093 RepID=A0A6A6P1W8_9PEZI|nr:hypothetical protein BDY21DRAFT_343439 [Lineolata rhizophorae]
MTTASPQSPHIWEPSSHPHPQPRQDRPPPQSRPTSSRTPSSFVPPHGAATELRTPLPRAPKDSTTSSPNYFGIAVDPERETFNSSANQHARANWSPPTSNVRSTAAMSPRVIPLEHNAEFEAFRRESERNSYERSTLTFPPFGDFGNVDKPLNVAPGRSSRSSSSPLKSQKPSASPVSPTTKAEGNGSSTQQSEQMPHPRSPKRLLSCDSGILDRPRRHSPASFTDNESDNGLRASPDPRHSRLSLPSDRTSLMLGQHQGRAETLPSQLESEHKPAEPTVVTPQHVIGLLEAFHEEVLLLDLRVSTQYFRSRICGALNLCIPTTLLKRPSFNVQKLAETFKDDEQRDRFERWRSSRYIIVYDGNSATLKDAISCTNILKKFVNEGWNGVSYIIRGGFVEFSKKFPNYITQDYDVASSSASSRTSSVDSEGPAVAQVCGGCPMPNVKSAANPFFGNIRQNMDLIGGVGQISVKLPSTFSKETEQSLPKWMQKAINSSDRGKSISNGFLQIERREQKRMQDALNGKVVYGSPTPNVRSSIQIAGIEKGSKNRYNNIWPYEHTRVKLQGPCEGGCDYINANHVKAAWSNKRYIATQGPMPATFNDFWNVVWQQDIRVIVMLTAEKEGGQVKAHNYWNGKRFGHINLNFLSEHRASLEPSRINRRRERPSMGHRASHSTDKLPKESSASPSTEQPYVIVRKFTLSNDDCPFERMREITQLQYSTWPDFGAPAHPAHLLGLVEQCDAVVRAANGAPSQYAAPDPPDARPVLVHCSAGCGRTGTFCTVDSVIDMLKRQRMQRSTRQGTPMDLDTGGSNPFFDHSLDTTWTSRDDVDLIEKTVEDFRLQRLSMVQSLRQYVLCYESVLEWLVEQSPKAA